MKQKKTLKKIWLVPLYLLFVSVFFCGLTCACSQEESPGKTAGQETRENMPPGKMLEFFLEKISQFDMEPLFPYMQGDLQKKMQAALPRFQATKAAYDKRDLLEFLIASGAEPKAANDIAGRIRDQKQEAVFWKAMESRMRSFNVQDIAIQEQIDGTDGKTAAVSWSFKNAGTGTDPDASRETLYFIRQDNGLWYWVSFADYTAFRKENGTIQDSGPELNAEAEDPFGLFSGRDHQ